jgi:hypothetical protein
MTFDTSTYDEQEQESPTEQSGINFVQIAIAVTVGLVLAIVVIFVVAIVLANNALGDVTTVAAIIQIIRDLLIIFVMLQGILIVVAFAIIIVQIARLVNLLQNEVKPILENTQDTVKTASGTVRFISDNLAQPIIKTSGFLAGVSVVLSNITGIRRATRRTPPDVSARAKDQDETQASE